MSDIYVSRGHFAAPTEYIKDEAIKVTEHPAWHGTLSNEQAETLLAGKPAFTYLLWETRDGRLHLSWRDDFINSRVFGPYVPHTVNEKLKVHHQEFYAIPGKGAWVYENHTVRGLTQHSVTLPVLISQMMQCEGANPISLQPVTNV